MKKFIFIVILALAGFVGKAQTAMINPNHFPLDTGSQALAKGPVTLVVKGTAKTFSIVLATTKLSGTIAGNISWQGSNDGVHFAQIGSTTALVDGSVNYTYKEVDKGYLYYKALITQTGTSSLSFAGTYYVTKPTISNGN